MLNFIATPNVVANSEFGYAFRLTFCHFANKNRYAQIISGYVRVNFGLPGIKAILSKSAFSNELVNSFSVALDLSLNPEIIKPLSNKVSLIRLIRTVFTFGEGRNITSLIYSFSAFLDWVSLSFFFASELDGCG